VDGFGDVYVADNRTIRKVTTAGVVVTIAGLAGAAGSQDGTNNSARFGFPYGVAVDTSGNLYVTDLINATIRKVSPMGTGWVVTTIAGVAGSLGNADGSGTNARFNLPGTITLDAQSNLYVMDSGKIRKLQPNGADWSVTTMNMVPGASGSPVGSVEGFAADRGGRLYVAQFSSSIVQDLTLVGTNWIAQTVGGLAGSQGSTDGTGSTARFRLPGGIAVDTEGNLYVADRGNNTIRKGVFTAYSAKSAIPHTQPPMTGQLTVTLLPSEANGQWRSRGSLDGMLAE
jgi:sugar lactone lactonase YvrE